MKTDKAMERLLEDILVDAYSVLLQKAVDSIVATFRRRVAAGLQSGRDFVIPDRSEQANSNADFDLVTWLVIK